MVSRVERPHIEENERRPCFDYSPTEIWLFFFLFAPRNISKLTEIHLETSI